MGNKEDLQPFPEAPYLRVFLEGLKYLARVAGELK
jgi:hypothetical protein